MPKVGDEVKGKDGVTRKVTDRAHLAATAREDAGRLHGLPCQGQVTGFYKQFDDLVVLYNDKFAKPAAAIMADLYKAEQTYAGADG